MSEINENQEPDDFEREKHRDEMEHRSREFDLRMLELQHSRWRSPLLIAVVAGVIGLVSSSVVALINNRSELAIAEKTAEADRILEAIRTGDPERAG